MYCITGEPIDVAAIQRSVVRDGERGGVVTFIGIVRDRAEDGRHVMQLTYEAHEPMAVIEFERIATEAKARFGDASLAIVHRVGRVKSGEAAVAVVAACVHRQAAFAACQFAIDELKRRAPIWKQECCADGSSTWKSNA